MVYLLIMVHANVCMLIINIQHVLKKMCKQITLQYIQCKVTIWCKTEILQNILAYAHWVYAISVSSFKKLVHLYFLNVKLRHFLCQKYVDGTKQIK